MTDSYVPNASVENLHCKRCQLYLSYFPIVLTKNGPVCGRCIKTPTEATVNEPYQTLAKHLKFPCINDKYGCLEHITPNNVPKHEKYCRFRRFNCPAGNCDWQGFTSNLIEHYENKHPSLFLKTYKFEVDFIKKYNENCLLTHGESIFIVNRNTNTKQNTFNCTLTYVGSNPILERCFYALKFQDGTKPGGSYILRNKIGETIEADAASLKQALQDPSTVTAEVEILTRLPVKQNVEEPNPEQVSMEKQLLSELECPVCFEHMIPPIIQCVKGHSMCKDCKGPNNVCPLCRGDIHDTQNYTLEKMCSFINYPCKYAKCSFTALSKDIKEHEKTCEHGSYDCSVQDYNIGCLWLGPLAEAYEHIVDRHRDHILDVDTIHMPFLNPEADDEDCFILQYCQRVFKLHCKYTQKKFYWSMQLVGPSDLSKNYKFEIDILDNSGNKMRRYVKSLCAPYTAKQVAFDKKSIFVTMDLEQLAPLITEEFSYRVRVLQE